MEQGNLFGEEKNTGFADTKDGEKKKVKHFVNTPAHIVNAEVAQAIKDGRHSSESLHVCDQCREWVTGIYHKTLDGKNICAKCFGVKSDPIAPLHIAQSAFNPFEDLPDEPEEPVESE